MVDPPPNSDLADDPGIPRWVKVSGAIVLLLILLFVILHLTGYGLDGHMHGMPATLPGGAQQP